MYRKLWIVVELLCFVEPLCSRRIMGKLLYNLLLLHLALKLLIFFISRSLGLRFLLRTNLAA